MGRFLIQVVLAFAFWAVVVWFGLPVMKDRAPSAYGRLAAIAADNTVGTRLSAAVESVEQTVEKNVKTISDNLPRVEIPEIKVELPKVFSREETKSTSTTTNLVTTQDENPPVIAEIVETPPDTKSALNEDPGYPWGIVVTNSFYYDSKMNRIGIFAGGTVVECKQSEVQIDGYVSECFYLIDRSWQPETVYLYEADLVKFDITYEVANVAQRDMLIEYCRVKGLLEELRGKAYKEALRKNPYFEQYKTATDAYKDFAQKTRTVKEEFDLASDARRGVLMDQLRRYKAEEVVIVQRYKALKEQYETWKSQNIGDEKTPRITKTVEIQNLENKLNAMRGTVQEIVPGL